MRVPRVCVFCPCTPLPVQDAKRFSVESAEGLPEELPEYGC